MNNTNSTLPVGTTLNGKYHIQSHLSSGGFGNTYLAVYGSYKKKVAIKEFFMRGVNQREDNGISVSISCGKGDTQLFNSQLEKFKKEAERLKQIKNVHVVKVHDLFEENGTAYYVMDFVEGYDLKDRLNRRGKPYTEKTIINYLRQILDGLLAIHSKNLLHLDIKPANIMVTRRGYVKLIDLGSSKDYMKGVGATLFTGLAMTNRYAPSEQVDGSFEKLGPWTDFYALGATIYYLLTCNEIPTWTALNEDKTRDKHIALPMPGVSDEMRFLVTWLMNTDREKRPHSVAEIRTRMESKKWAGSPYDDTTVLAGDTEEVTVIGKRKQTPRQEVSHQTEGISTTIGRTSTSRQNDTQEKEPEFSFVGCLYILIIIAIVVFVVKFLFMT